MHLYFVTTRAILTCEYKCNRLRSLFCLFCLYKQLIIHYHVKMEMQFGLLHFQSRNTYKKIIMPLRNCIFIFMFTLPFKYSPLCASLYFVVFRLDTCSVAQGMKIYKSTRNGLLDTGHFTVWAHSTSNYEKSSLCCCSVQSTETLNHLLVFILSSLESVPLCIAPNFLNNKPSDQPSFSATVYMWLLVQATWGHIPYVH